METKTASESSPSSSVKFTGGARLISEHGRMPVYHVSQLKLYYAQEASLTNPNIEPPDINLDDDEDNEGLGAATLNIHPKSTLNESVLPQHLDDSALNESVLPQHLDDSALNESILLQHLDDSTLNESILLQHLDGSALN
jgi:hypothetical protein